MHSAITTSARDTCVERARNDADFVREVLREAQTLMLRGERDAAGFLLDDLARGAPNTALSTEQAANLLGISRWQTDKLVEQGLLLCDSAKERRLVLCEVVRYRKICGAGT